MNNALKGALLSGLVFPGLGQLVLRQYRRGLVIMLAVLISLAVIVIKAVQYAQVILENIELQGDVIDMTAISNAATRESLQSGSVTLNLLMLFIIVCWIAGTVDAYIIGRKKDRKGVETA
ncbi:MAG: hypothetical protein PVH38_06305 [Gammaproteobacteria bacterium]|jgi:TM2 domain-containing membrane protein YozV